MPDNCQSCKVKKCFGTVFTPKFLALLTKADTFLASEIDRLKPRFSSKWASGGHIL